MFRQIGESGEQEEQMDIKRVWEECERNWKRTKKKSPFHRRCPGESE